MSESFSCLIMLAPAGPSELEQWLGRAKLAAAEDLCRRLRAVEAVGRLTVASANDEYLEVLGPLADETRRTSRQGFHWGRAVHQWASEMPAGPVAVLGGASAPLASAEMLAEQMARLLAGGARCALVNNLHSSDWALLSAAGGLEPVLDVQPSDNGIGWALSQEPEFEVLALPPSAASRCDLDTPADLVMLHGHPAMGPALTAHIEESEFLGPALDRRRRLEQVLATPAASLAVIGRASAAAWRALESATQLWIRVYAEERGMVASGRLQRGEVRSLLHETIAQVGAAQFVRWLAQTVSAALWDTRVWMGASGGWPSVADRFAADLGLADQIRDAESRQLVAAIEEAPIPIVSGGHNVVAGGLLAMLETIGTNSSSS